MGTPKIGRSVRVGSGVDFSEEPELSEVPVPSQKPRLVSPEEAGEVLLSYLPADAQKLLREAAALQGRATWHVLLGYALRAYERFDMFMYSHLDSWERQVKPTSPWRCQTCAELMWNRFPESRYCCNACFFGKLAEKGHGELCLRFNLPPAAEETKVPLSAYEEEVSG